MPSELADPAVLDAFRKACRGGYASNLVGLLQDFSRDNMTDNSTPPPSNPSPGQQRTRVDVPNYTEESLHSYGLFPEDEEFDLMAVPELSQAGVEATREALDEQESLHRYQAEATGAMLRAVHWCLNFAANNKSWEKLREISPSAELPFPFNMSHWQLMHWIELEANLDIRLFDCCVNGCQAFTDAYAEANVCEGCKEPRYRYNAAGEKLGPRQVFTYISPINRLRAIYTNKEYCAMIEEFAKRRQTSANDSIMEDVFDGEHYRKLLREPVSWNGQIQHPRRNYFEGRTDIALGLSTDGVPLYKRSRLDAWPLLLTNFSLPPEARTRQGYQVCCGIIPGTSTDTDRTLNLDTFLWPLIQDLKTLAISGVSAQRWEDARLVNFTLRGHLILINGDMPAIAKMKAAPKDAASDPNDALQETTADDEIEDHIEDQEDFPPEDTTIDRNGLSEAQESMTNVIGGGSQEVESSTSEPLGQAPQADVAKPRTKTTYYPGRKPTDLLEELRDREIKDIDYTRLPLRTDSSVKEDVNRVIAPGITETERGRRALDCGISGAVGSISFPTSFPVDIMHLLLENVMKQLLEMWDGSFKAQTMLGNRAARHVQPFVIPKKGGWDEIDAMIVKSSKLIPSSMSGTLTAASNRWRWTAATHLFFLITLGPIVLKTHLPPPYFDHFLDLSELTKILIGLTIDKPSQLPYVKQGLLRWVRRFDELYYQFKYHNLPMCTSPIHGLLHVAECIEQQGPLCKYWCFSMERYCGWIKRKAQRNRSTAITALMNSVVEKVLAGHPSPTGVLLFMGFESEELPGARADAVETVRCGGAYSCILTNKLPNQQSTSASRYNYAIATHLTSRYYNNADMRAKRLRRVTVAEVAQSPLTFWTTLTCHKDFGGHKYRCLDESSGRARDKSWAKPEVGYGKILVFIEIVFEKERLLLVVIEPYDTEPWINVPNAPVLLKRPRGLQVLDVNGLLAPLGRVSLEKGKRFVAFDTSMGGVAPELIEED